MLVKYLIATLLQIQAQAPHLEPVSFLARLKYSFSHVNINNFLILSGLLFVIGVTGVLTRRNLIIILMSIELILNAVNINLIAFSQYWQANPEPGINPYMGQIFTVFVIVVAAAEAAIGLGIIIAFYRNRETTAVDEINLMKW